MNFLTTKLLYINFFLTLVVLITSKVWILSLIGFNYEQSTTVYAIGSFMTERGVFDDFYNSVNVAKELPNPNSSYLLTPLLTFFSKFAQSTPKIAHALFLLFGTILWITGLKKTVGSSKITFLLLLSYPILFAISRSNGIFIGSACLMLAYSYAYMDRKNDKLSVALAALAISFHPGTLILALGLPIRNYFKCWKILLIIGLVNLGIIFYLSNIDLLTYADSYFKSLSLYKKDYILGGGGTLFNNSLFGLIKISLMLLSETKIKYEYVLNLVSNAYSIMLSIVTVTLAGYAIFSRNWIKKTLLLSCATILFPQISADYKLQFLVMATAILIYCNRLNIIQKPSQYFKLLFIFVLISFPKHIIFFRNFSDYGEFFTLQSILNPLLLIYAFYLISVLKLDQMKAPEA